MGEPPMSQLSYLVFESIQFESFVVKRMLSLNKYLLRMFIFNKLLSIGREGKQGNMK